MYYPPVGFRFKVEFAFLGADGKDGNEASFQEVSGLSAEVGIEELQEGGENRFSHRLPTRSKYGNLVLKRGYLTNTKIRDWVQHAIHLHEATPKHQPSDVNVTLLDEEGQPLSGTFSFIKAWPIKWSLSDFKAMENAIVVETLELSYQYFEHSKS